MTPDAAAVFAQVLSMLFIATFLQFRRFQGNTIAGLAVLFSTTFSVFALGYLLVAVAADRALPLIGAVLTWTAIVIHLFTLTASAIHEYVRYEREPSDKVE